ncbi:hypothetical protein ES708_33844 [subsurface metagenome]
MRVIVTLTIDGTKETRIEGEAQIYDAPDIEPLEPLEARGIGFWLDNWRYAGVGSPNHKGQVFCPWTSVLMVETKEAK